MNTKPNTFDSNNMNQPTQQKISITDFIYKLENPQLYTGREINAIRKDITRKDDFIHICLVFPDKYEIGMSHYGLTLLYHFLNKFPNVNAERCFLPGKPSIELFKQYEVPLFSLENKIPLKNFDLIAISMMSELNYTNVFPVLELAQIPFRTSERSENQPFPIIAAGGISTVNPEPLREFIDIFGMGDGEVLFPDIIETISNAKKQKENRSALLKSFDSIPGVYVPSLYPVVKKGRFFAPDIEPGKIKKRIIKSLDGTFPEPEIITPISNIVFNRLNIEIARGCPQNCRFCQAKSYYSPYRYRPLDENIHQIANGLRQTGYETFSLSTLSTGDYPFLNQLLPLIPEILAVQPGVNFSLSSLRPSTLSHDLLQTIALYKRTGITIVPEAGTQRLRNVINKNVTDEEIFQAVELALQNHWQKIKLYFMLGLPTETREDIEGIVLLIRKMIDMSKAAKQKIKINASFSPFVPKPQTPLQWASGVDVDKIFESIRYIKNEMRSFLKYGNVEFDFHLPQTSQVETILARGDYRVGELLFQAYKQGEIFTAWDVDFHYDTWASLFKNTEYEDFIHEFPIDEPLPWDFALLNYFKEGLKDEYKKALAAEPTQSCITLDCAACGKCSFKMNRAPLPDPSPIIWKLREEIDEMKLHIPSPLTFKQIRVFYEKRGDFILFSHLAMMQYVERLIRKTGIHFKITEGFTPRIKIQMLPALPVFASSFDEAIELYVDASINDDEILERLNKSAEPQGFHFKKVVTCENAKTLAKDIKTIGYEIHIENPEQFKDSISTHLVESDSVSYTEDRIILDIDYSTQGQERFAKIYKIIDPEKKNTLALTRTHVSFNQKPF